MRVLLTFLFALTSYHLFGQNTVFPPHQAHLDAGNVRALINSNGLLFHDTSTNQASFEVPKGSGLHTIFNSGFIISYTNTQNGFSNYGIAQNIKIDDSDFSVGPIHIANQQPDFNNRFQQLWKVDKTDIESHITNWNSSNYTTPSSIKNWPGNGSRGTATNLAPFVDVNNDSIYNPAQGDYPKIKGDQAVFLMYNNFNLPENPTIRVVPVYDDFGNVTGLDSVPVYEKSGESALEFHLMLYSFDKTGTEINDAVFVNTKIFNRSSNSIGDLTDFKFSVFTDFDLGNFQDDFLGTDTVRNMYYGYNADNFDDSTGNRSGYGRNLAAQGLKFLNHNLYSSMRRLSTNSSPFPELPIHFRNYQNSIWQNGRPLYYGGDGFDFQNRCADSSKQVKYIFSGDPTLVGDTTQWTELNPCFGDATTTNLLEDRQMLGTIFIPQQINHGASLEIDYAYVFAQDTGIVESISSLKLTADSVQAFYDRFRFVGIDKTSLNSSLEFGIYPNPTNELFNIQTDLKNLDIEIFNLQGQILNRFQNKKTIDVSNLSRGVYFVKLISEGKIGVKRLVIE